MTTTFLLLIAGSVGLAISLLLTPLISTLARMLGLLDRPDARKVHRLAVPRIGGVAIAIAGLAGLGLGIALLPAGWDNAGIPIGWSAVLGTSLMILCVGLLDDLIDLSGKWKLLALFVCSAILCFADVRVDKILINGEPFLELGIMAWPMTMIFIAGLVVSFNFIDGLDGLAAGIALLTSLALATTAYTCGAVVIAIGAIALAGSLLGFLVFNRHPAKIFMGDCGSMFVGYLLASLMILNSNAIGTSPGLLLPMLPMAIPVIDTILTLLRRSILQRRSVFSAEQGHVHHRLLAVGMRHPHAVWLLHGVSVVAAGVAVLLLFAAPWLKATGLILMFGMVAFVLRIAGSVRLRETISAIRHNRKLAREQRRLQEAFEDQQLRFRRVTNFEQWWEQVCRCAEALDFAEIRLPLTQRDGTKTLRKWSQGAPGTRFDDEALAAQVPVRQRRELSALRLEAVLGPAGLLETASQRLMLFSRLLDEHSVASLDKSSTKSSPHPASGIAATIFREVQAPDHACPELKKLRVAVVHDFLYTYAGAERVLEQILEICPQANLFSLFDFLPADQRGFIRNKPVKTSFLQKLPGARKHHRAYLPLMPLAAEQLDVTDYDLVISSSYVAAKGVITSPNQLHICYCHSPARFAWDLQSHYLNTVGLKAGLKAFAARALLHYIRTWDVRSANGVDVFLSNSDFVARRIEKVYRRSAIPVPPPVNVDKFPLHSEKEDFYVTVSRLVPYKRVDLVVEAFNRMPDKRLFVIGDGPEHARIAAQAGSNVRMVGYQSDERVKFYLQHAKGFVFAAEEDFGIVAVEAQACGTPVIALGRGGALETVLDGKTGVFFNDQTPDSLIDAIARFEELTFNPETIRANAERFNEAIFRANFASTAVQAWKQHQTPRVRAETNPEGREDSNLSTLGVA